jgi:Bacteriophage HK97-gp10, putative tail-component
MAADFIASLRQHVAEQDKEGNLTDAKIAMAQEGVAIAKAKAPVDEGDYRDGIQVGRRGASGVGVEFTDWKSRLIEYGTEGTPEYAVAAQTAEQLRSDT